MGSLTDSEITSVGRPASSAALSEQAHRAITELIRTRKLRGGDIVVEQRLADNLGISRTPLREALQRLEGEGLIIKAAGRSYAVRRVDLTEYLHSLKAREILEGEAAALAAGRAPAEKIAEARAEIEELTRRTRYHTGAHWRSDDRVHGLLADYCGNAVVAKLIGGLRATTRLFEVVGIAERVGPDSEEHLKMLDGLESGDPRASRRAVQAHIRSLTRHALSDVR